jgi:hypothetical protein
VDAVEDVAEVVGKWVGGVTVRPPTWISMVLMALRPA